MKDRVVARFLAAADDPKKLLQKGMDDPGLKHVQRAWDDFTKDVAEAQRQYNAVGGAHPTSVINELVSKFIHKPLKNLSEEAEGWADRIEKMRATRAASEGIRVAKDPHLEKLVKSLDESLEKLKRAVRNDDAQAAYEAAWLLNWDMKSLMTVTKANAPNP